MKYKIPCVWQSFGIVEIEADNLDEAIEKANNAPLPEAEYIEDSFEVDIEALEYYNDNGIKF